MAGFDDFKGLFQPKWFSYSKWFYTFTNIQRDWCSEWYNSTSFINFSNIFFHINTAICY